VGVGRLVVGDQEHPLGVVTDRDLALRVLREDLDPERVQVRDPMRSPVVRVAADAPLAEGVRALRWAAVRRIVVIDDKQEVVGLFAADDLLRILVTELGDLADALRVQFAREAGARGAAEERSHA